MEKTMIYYFSGTGNTLFIARELSMLLGGELIPIVSTTGMAQICPDGDVIGIVYPVYYGELPPVVNAFAKKLTGLENKYLFAVSNYGGASGFSIKTLEERVLAAGGELAAAYGIHMPQNAFLKFWENNGKTVEKSRRRIKSIADNTVLRKKEIRIRSLLERMVLLLHPRFVPLYRKKLAALSGEPIDADFDVMIRHMDRNYTTNEKCTGCGICAKVCPVGNIELSDKKPRWQGRCENCLACYDWCPVKAIEGSVASKDYYYVNPKVRISDITAQRN